MKGREKLGMVLLFSHLGIALQSMMTAFSQHEKERTKTTIMAIPNNDKLSLLSVKRRQILCTF
jgi:hypothetical protein